MRNRCATLTGLSGRVYGRGFAFKGDLAAKHAFLAGEFKAWLDRVPATDVVLVAGNHDQSIEAWGLPSGLRCHYLQDAGVELAGLKLWGTPWQPWFYDWAFDAPRRGGEAFLASKFDLIPDDTDVVVCAATSTRATAATGSARPRSSTPRSSTTTTGRSTLSWRSRSDPTSVPAACGRDAAPARRVPPQPAARSSTPPRR